MMNALICLGLTFLFAQIGPGQIELSASTNQAYEGQIVDLHLTLRLPTRSTPYSVNIPWLETRSPAFELVLPLKEWVCECAVPKAQSLPLRWRGYTLYAAMVRPGEFELRWQLRVLMQPENGEPIRLDAVQIESMKSPSLAIQVLPSPSAGASSSVWDLGVGSYQLKASWQKNEVVLGEETLLLLEVSGQGDLANIGPPRLTSQPGWEHDAYLLEPAPETWKDKRQVRVFRYRVRPRRLGTRAPSGVTVQFFDPKSNYLQTMRIRTPVLNIISHETAGPTPSDPKQTLSISWQQTLEAHNNDSNGRLILSRIVMTLPVIFAFLIIGRVISTRFFANALARRRWRSAGQRAERQIDSITVAGDGEDWKQLLVQFLSHGLQRRIASDTESVRSAFATSTFSDQSRLLVQAMQELEFGPSEYRRQEKVRSIAKQFFLEMESYL